MLPQTEAWLPLFPLNTVLFPQGVLPLRVFETRYIDMVRECMKQERPFGVVLIRAGQEVGAAAEPERVGTLAHMRDWDMAQLGLMSLVTEGGERFRIEDTRVLPDQRLEARVHMLAPDGMPAADALHVACAGALKTVIENVERQGRAEQGKDFISPFSQPLRLDSAGWVANRWCELLPIPLKARQALLELEDPRSRLEVVHQFLTQHGII
ncbi:LON peptidase substrate-binding domain-containing protein [Noviherbaspirillum aridicola]|uniref:ATP-dependent protease n=1 Tax=Noviherbaspirillum aridicola TaxID=2849687 RepID=A0ABQ4Q1E5_9BURK|nr:LON peptidase substrate-binding domain-containing protein [Noviherbaspirillum aridicola]GIZ50871.1 ATP-dependent protease [Noviherbaspirillum aridicola]